MYKLLMVNNSTGYQLCLVISGFVKVNSVVSDFILSVSSQVI